MHGHKGRVHCLISGCIRRWISSLEFYVVSDREYDVISNQSKSCLDAHKHAELGRIQQHTNQSRRITANLPSAHKKQYQSPGNDQPTQRSCPPPQTDPDRRDSPNCNIERAFPPQSAVSRYLRLKDAFKFQIPSIMGMSRLKFCILNVDKHMHDDGGAAHRELIRQRAGALILFSADVVSFSSLLFAVSCKVLVNHRIMFAPSAQAPSATCLWSKATPKGLLNLLFCQQLLAESEHKGWISLCFDWSLTVIGD